MSHLPKFIATALVLVSGLALADATVFPVQGMHCESCVKTLDVGVCEKMKDEVKSCQVKLLDPKAEKGQIMIEPLAGKPLDSAKVASLVKKSGYKADMPAADSAAKTH